MVFCLPKVNSISRQNDVVLGDNEGDIHPRSLSRFRSQDGEIMNAWFGMRKAPTLRRRRRKIRYMICTGLCLWYDNEFG